jgi:hypothetical protein
MTKLIANCSVEDEIYLLTTAEITETQWADPALKHLFKRNAVIDNRLEVKLIESTVCVCKDGWLVIPKPLQLKYGQIPSKTVISNPWECLCVNLIGQYSLKGRDNLKINFMDLTMIDPTSSWFESSTPSHLATKTNSQWQVAANS